MKMFTFFATTLSLLTAPAAQAFHIPEHLLITQRAIIGLQKCNLLPQNWDLGWTQAIQDGNKHEDTNLFRKWSKYSHFYSPKKQLRSMGRADSMLSVQESEQSLSGHHHEEEEAERSVFLLVGRIVHHIQDAAVPSHVVPVNHFADDGFEKTELRNYYDSSFSITDCPRIRAAEPSHILRNTALTTLARIEKPVSFRTYKRVKQAPWSKVFWQASTGEGFGEYGLLGNGFGKAVIELEDGRTAHVEPSQYHGFKRAQVELAVAATQAAILWANQKVLKEE